MLTTRSIRNCLPVFRFVCPQQWEELTPTGEPGVRDCGECHRRVYFCTTDAETIAHVRAGDCIAREVPDSSEARQLFLGRGEVLPPTPRQEEAERLLQRERGIDEAIQDFRYSSRSCPECGYPSADWRLWCKVCGFEVGRVQGQ